MTYVQCLKINDPSKGNGGLVGLRLIVGDHGKLSCTELGMMLRGYLQ